MRQRARRVSTFADAIYTSLIQRRNHCTHRALRSAVWPLRCEAREPTPKHQKYLRSWRASRPNCCCSSTQYHMLSRLASTCRRCGGAGHRLPAQTWSAASAAPQASGVAASNALRYLSSATPPDDDGAMHPHTKIPFPVHRSPAVLTVFR